MHIRQVLAQRHRVGARGRRSGGISRDRETRGVNREVRSLGVHFCGRSSGNGLELSHVDRVGIFPASGDTRNLTRDSFIGVTDRDCGCGGHPGCGCVCRDRFG